jgi:hypothetical protein
MKKIILLFVAIVSLSSITSCSNDDDSDASLIGKWQYTKEGISANGQEALTDYEHAEGCTKDYIQITATTVTDHTFYNDGDCTEDTFTVNYSRNGSTLTVGTGSDASVAQIATLTDTTLKITYTDSDFPGVLYVDVYTRVN